MKVRTRFAPSPTGALHVGGIRTALFAWLVARQTGGQFVLRLEDTDKKREIEGAERQIEDSLKSLGLNYDEGPDIGGPFAPYRQSERLDSYNKWAKKLADGGGAYADPYTPEEVQAFREQAQAAKKPFLYRDHRPDNPLAWREGLPLRLKSDPKSYEWHDEVMGDLSSGPEVIDDFILIKSDGYPTYNFSHIVDDAEMEISHVIRGQEFISSTPNYLNLYEALGIKRPLMATMPHILGPDGKKKLSKRDGARDVLDYIKAGYLPEALVSFIATLGWNDGTKQEVFTIDELIQKFSLDRVQHSGAKFDERRLQWTNGHFIRESALADLFARSRDFWPPEAAGYDDGYKTKVLGLLQERLKYLAEIPELSWFFFKDPSDEETKAQIKSGDKAVADRLGAVIENISASDFSFDDLKSRLNKLLNELGTVPVVLFSEIRGATTGARISPELFGTLSVLGKDRVLQRLQRAVSILEN